MTLVKTREHGRRSDTHALFGSLEARGMKSFARGKYEGK